MSRVVVGVDGSPASGEALRWAAAHARAAGSGLLLLHAYHAGDAASRRVVGSALGTGASAATLAREGAAEILDEVRGAHRDELEGLDVATEAREGGAAAVLVAASDDAPLLVVGSRGRGGFAGLLLGSVSQQCVLHAACPVVVVRPG